MLPLIFTIPFPYTFIYSIAPLIYRALTNKTNHYKKTLDNNKIQNLNHEKLFINTTVFNRIFPCV